MGVWTLASMIVLALVAGTVVVLLRDGEVPRGEARRPEWLLPTPADLREPRFGFAWQGYDPAEVDALLDAAAVAYEELVLAAGPGALSQAEARVASRRGREHEIVPPAAEDLDGGSPASPSQGDDLRDHSGA
ncbi:MAG: DivIVA domain-containing protein [Nitriliruptorales bacterium]|nr:DivIVA domain-containing protein [Nitriliruptorales bacterium]